MMWQELTGSVGQAVSNLEILPMQDHLTKNQVDFLELSTMASSLRGTDLVHQVCVLGNLFGMRIRLRLRKTRTMNASALSCE